MANTIKVEHGGVTIVYDENESKFVFELRGRERKVDTLAAAKEVIDKPVPISKKKVDPVAGWVSVDEWGSNPKKFKNVLVTSIAESPSWRDREVWISDNGKRSKISADKVFADTPLNAGTRAAIEAKAKEISALETAKEALLKSLKRVDLKVFEGE